MCVQKNWIGQKYSQGGYREYEGTDENDLPPVQTNNIIKMKTTKKVGDKIYLRMQARPASGLSLEEVHLEGIEGNFQNNKVIAYTIKNQQFSVQGDIFDFECFENDITELDLSDCHSVEVLNCSRNKIASLDLTKLRKLELLFCYFNNLTTFDFSGNPKLFHVDMRMNQVGEKEFTTVVNTVCDKQYDKESGLLVFTDVQDPNVKDPNRANPEQIKAMKQKNWVMVKVVGEHNSILDFEPYTKASEIQLEQGEITQIRTLKTLVLTRFAPNTSINLYNSMGEAVIASITNSQGQANISYQSLPNGIYFIKVGDQVTKLIL